MGCVRVVPDMATRRCSPRIQDVANEMAALPACMSPVPDPWESFVDMSVSLIISHVERGNEKASCTGMHNHLPTARLTHREPRLSFTNHDARVPTSTNADNGAMGEMQCSRLRALFRIVQYCVVVQGTHDLSSTTYDSPSATVCRFTILVSPMLPF
ncbi:hypothetical protein BKA80DRAFT_281046 [Phyllosticta citrichinensis]